MSSKASFGTRNSVTVAAAQPVNKNLFEGLSKIKDRYEKSDSEIVTLKRCEVKETARGGAMVCIEIAGKNIDPLFITPMKGVGHMVGGEKKFWKIEAIKQVESFTFRKDGYEITVPEEDVIGVLDSLPFGEEIDVKMKNGYVFEGKVCDINRTRRFQFFKIVEAIGDKLGLTVGNTVVEGGVAKAILRQGRPVSSEEFNQLFRERGIGATIQCRFSKNNLTGKSSLYDIQIPENR
jgi:hypothetical protein